jgi:hypothetical protein
MDHRSIIHSDSSIKSKLHPNFRTLEQTLIFKINSVNK